MEDLKNKLNLILYDLQEGKREMGGNKDNVENACCRIHTAIFDLEQLYKALCAKADEM
jgi:hypothetical protein